MEFETTVRVSLLSYMWSAEYFAHTLSRRRTLQDSYGAQGPNSGRIKCNLGAIYVSTSPTNPLLVVGQTHPGGYPALGTDLSKATHTGSELCKLTGYQAPTGLKYEWAGVGRGGEGKVSAELEVKVGTEEGKGGLIQKVGVLAKKGVL